MVLCASKGSAVNDFSLILLRFFKRFNKLSKQFVITIILFVAAVFAAAQTTAPDRYGVRNSRMPLSHSIPDSLMHVRPDSAKSGNIFQKFLDYLSESNKPKPGKMFDFSVLGGPYYASDTKFGIGLVAAGNYRHYPSDSLPIGQVSLYGDVSITGYFKVGIEGSDYYRRRAHWLSYDMFFSSMPDNFWGIGYDRAHIDSNITHYKRWKAALTASYLFSVFTPHFYVGPQLTLAYIDGKNIHRPWLWNFQKHRTFTAGLGVSMAFDSRDFEYNAARGIYARADVMTAPKFANKYDFTKFEATLCHYFRPWSSAVLASRAHVRFTWGNTPWGEMSQLGGSSNMRGYWEGRYNDKCAADATVELRQHVWRRFGVVGWAGIGEVFPALGSMMSGHALWNAGIGLRWEFKHRVNVRIDYGFGQNQNGLVFSINEAF